MGGGKQVKTISSSEMLLMKCIWDAEGELSIPQLMELVHKQYGKEYKRTTVVTFLSRLQEKGYVQTCRRGRLSYVYAVCSEEKYKASIACQYTHLWFEGRPSNFLSALIGEEGITKEEAGRIRRMLDELDDE